MTAGIVRASSFVLVEEDVKLRGTSWLRCSQTTLANTHAVKLARLFVLRSSPPIVEKKRDCPQPNCVLKMEEIILDKLVFGNPACTDVKKAALAFEPLLLLRKTVEKHSLKRFLS